MIVKNVYEAITIKRKAKYLWLQDNLGVSESTIVRAINDLKELGYINKEHSKIKSEWQLLKWFLYFVHCNNYFIQNSPPDIWFFKSSFYLCGVLTLVLLLWRKWRVGAIHIKGVFFTLWFWRCKNFATSNCPSRTKQRERPVVVYNLDTYIIMCL